ncbi:potassium channel family protein [Leptolyngbya sp. 7M]|uniref:potassium channel family protein n=1 Tax=Leptolyngbya sp. 7M TaxID=2812896 RepID=UPI001B8B5E83|nr:potassium channel family protein [Leptolyngbya sp. 7M]QYO68381.1 potassium channel family protein [Leptolyngbya sp. 7M]
MRFHELIRAAENKYNRLLTLLILIYLLSPFVEEQSIGILIFLFVFLVGLITVVYQIQHSQWALKVHIGLVFLALLLRILSDSLAHLPNDRRVLATASMVIFLAFLVLSVYLILRELAIVEQVTADIIKGGICIYLLLGFLWAALYEIVYSFDASSFTAASTPLTRADLAHFSFTTLTTVGYGDISPASRVARVLANLEGMVGVIYPAVFIARLVSLYK